MTICVQKKPFEKVGYIIRIVLQLIPLAWIIAVPFLYLSGHELLAMFGIAQATCFPIFSYSILKELNDKHHWVEWCKQPKEQK